MIILKRIMFYLTRKKGKTAILFMLIFLIGTFVLTGFSLLYATNEVATHMRTIVGAAIHIRPIGAVSTEADSLIEGDPAVITEQEVSQIMRHEQVLYYNGRNTGYAKGMSFIKGMGNTEENNMGRLISNHYTVLAPEFQTGKLVLEVGRHITENDRKTIIISELLAAENNLSIGDVVTLTAAELSQSESGIFIDSLNHLEIEIQAEIIGIFSEREPQVAAELQPTAGLQSNTIFSDHQLLDDLELSYFGEYRNGVSFYLQEPQHLERVVEQIQQTDIIDKENFFIRADDFEYAKISVGLRTIQNLITTLLSAVSIVSIVILFLVLIMRMRSRLHETGILLSLGIPKKEILGQFILEIIVIALVAFVFSYVAASIIFGGIEKGILENLQIVQIEKQMLETGLIGDDIMLAQIAIPSMITIFIYTILLLVIVFTTLLSTSVAIRLKPREILSRMS